MSDRTPLAEAVDKDPVSENEPVYNRVTNIGNESFIGDINFHRTAEFLEIDSADRSDHDVMKKIETLFGWGINHSGSQDHVDVLHAIKGLKGILGLTSVGKDSLDKMYRWVRLDTKQQRIQKEKSLLSAN